MVFAVAADKHLAHFIPVFYFYTPWKHQNTRGLLVFPGSIGRDQTNGMKWVDKNRKKWYG